LGLAELSTTRRAIVLKLHGADPMSINDLAEALETTTSAVRQAVAPLAEDGYLAADKLDEEKTRRGRKRYVYRLTGKGLNSLFPTLQPEFVSGLIDHLRDNAPDLLVSFMQTHLSDYVALAKEFSNEAPIEERLARHEDYYTRSGYFPKVTRLNDGIISIDLRNCPGVVLGEFCEQLCEAETDALSLLFSPEYRTTRTEWRFEGNVTCVFRLNPAQNYQKRSRPPEVSGPRF
jgi:predicted ArsR family transcriptional regulator